MIISRPLPLPAPSKKSGAGPSIVKHHQRTVSKKIHYSKGKKYLRNMRYCCMFPHSTGSEIEKSFGFIEFSDAAFWGVGGPPHPPRNRMR